MLYAMYAYYVTCSRTSVLFTGIINIALALISARAEGSHFCALYRSSVCVCLHPFRSRLHQIIHQQNPISSARLHNAHNTYNTARPVQRNHGHLNAAQYRGLQRTTA